MSKKTWIYISRYLLAIGLYVIYCNIFDKHDISWIVIAFTIGYGLGAFPAKSGDQHKK
ncbi:hypothetical protein [Lentilactobacillus hilgardii]|uniref:hypothetical protein n=1 Tax=Lentilactobacillus hilgardii TaxID=1588 RepID=UPI0021C3391C|nr:hypothetical protein [Lentilactobacillus hilgardii]MCP9334129.1 hypothetical protein [Lentilactobacillus hilgardii]MCP9350745.1 hypothetical protein [Lentilactobacillus hilgardii]MCP9353606.1 hypothetical protein [Lentilactobacillus hilgardii]